MTNKNTTRDKRVLIRSPSLYTLSLKPPSPEEGETLINS